MAKLDRVKQAMIRDDINYDSGEEERLARKYPKDYNRFCAHRKRIRERESEDDMKDKLQE